MSEKFYENISVAAPDGEILSLVPSKRARWYLRKGLATKVSEHQIRLNFEPAARTKLSAWYLIEHKNRCVICGETDPESLQKHHVVPACLRTWMREELKSHRSFDVLMVCESCHREYEIEALKLKQVLAQEAGAKWIGTGSAWREVEDKTKGLRHALALSKGKVRESSVEKLSQEVVKWLGAMPDQAELPMIEQNLKQTRRDLADKFFRTLVEFHAPNENLIRRWRHHFVDMTGPRFLEPEWLADIEVVG